MTVEQRGNTSGSTVAIGALYPSFAVRVFGLLYCKGFAAVRVRRLTPLLIIEPA